MSRPLVISDCDEVLLHMVRHFRDWLDEVHEIEFALEGNPFAESMTRRGTQDAISQDEMWALLGSFFDTEMPRQTLIPGAAESVRELQRDAEFVILTNLADARNAARKTQLQALGIEAKVYTNTGPKGDLLARIIAEHGAERAVFIDDIANHHASAAQFAPQVRRLQFCGEPSIAPHIPCAHIAGHAHARIDNWNEALPWVLEALHGENA